MTLREYVATYGDKMFSLRGQAQDTRIYIYGSDPQLGLYTNLTEDGWLDFEAVTEYAQEQGCTHIEHNTWLDGTIHTELIPLESEARA
jgi:hypothetical protein